MSVPDTARLEEYRGTAVTNSRFCGPSAYASGPWLASAPLTGLRPTREPYRGASSVYSVLLGYMTVGFAEGTLRLAKRMAPRCERAGIEIALVGSRGEVIDVRS